MDRTPPNLSPPDNETLIQPDKENLIDPEELLSRVRARYDDGVGAFEENRRMHSEDLNFVYNSEAMGQWDPVVLEARRGKPCYTFNRVLGPVNLVVADMRQTRPDIKVRPASKAASEAVADIFEGLIRSIDQASRASVIYKNQFKFAVAGGFGAWRILPEYAGEDTFDQVLRIRDIPNPQTVIWDPECSDACAGDAMWCIIGDRISKEKYRTLYPDADSESAFQISRDSYGWFTDKEVRVVEYMERVPFKKMIALLDDGRVVDYDSKTKAAAEHMADAPNSPKIISTREVLKWRVMWCKVDGGQLLEGPIYYDWKRIPVVRVPGRYINIEGRKKLQSLVRHTKDAQRDYNTMRSAMIERAAMIPKAPYLVTETMVKGYESEWAQSNTSPRPYLPFNVDPKASEMGRGGPERVPPIDVPQGSIALVEQSAQDIQATIGYFDPAMGNAEDMNRVSGKALVQHTRRSDLSSFEFIDGLGDALQLTGEMELDMIPTIYVGERIERIVSGDDIEKLITINQQQDDGQIVNDLKAGAYDCSVNIGPSYQTARQETLQTLIDAAGTIPMIAQVAPDLIAKNIDSPDADELSRRLRIPLIHNGIIKPTEEEAKNMPPPPPPDPLQQAETERMQALAKRDGANAILAQNEVQNLPLKNNKLLYETAGKHLDNLKTGADMGNSQAAAQAEAQQAQQEAQQSAQQHQQDMAQQQSEGAQGLAQQTVQGAMDLHQANQQHNAEMTRTEQKHKQAMQHAEEKHAQALKHAKALAAAKPKSTSK